MALNEWSEEEISLLNQYYPTTRLDNMVKYLPIRTPKAIRSKASALKILKAVGFGKTKKWTSEDLEYLRKHYSNTENHILMDYFDCSLKSLYSAAKKIEVKKSPEYISKICGVVLREVGKNTRFSKGSIPVNKGKKQVEYMSEESIKKTCKTRFKKGDKPHNIVEVGSERITKDGYFEVKVGDFTNDASRNFKLKHRIIWEQYYGEIPDKFQVRFKDGNKMNFDIDNLILVSLSESLKINSMSDSSIAKRFLSIKDPNELEKVINDFPSIIEVKRNIIKLSQKLKKDDRKTSTI